MASYSVAARGLPPIEVEAPNWIVALGMGLERLERSAAIVRLACEALPNGTIIARDITHSVSYVVQSGVDEEAATTESAVSEDIIEVPGESGTMDHPAGPYDEVSTEEGAGEVAIRLCREAVPAECASVILDEGSHLRFIAVQGPGSEKLIGLKIPPGTGIAGYSMSKKRSVVLGSASDDMRHFGAVDAMTGVQTREILCVPILDGDSVHGVIEMMNLPEGMRFTREDVHKVQTVANLLGAQLTRLG